MPHNLKNNKFFYYCFIALYLLFFLNLQSKSIECSQNLIFSNINKYNVGQGPLGLISEDFNNDSILDLATVNSKSNSLSVLFGTGNGAFSNSAEIPVGIQPYLLTSMDFNNDSFSDIAITNYKSNNISIVLSNGNKTFKRTITHEYGNGPVAIASADFNNDNFQDLAFTNYTSQDVSISLGKGNGEFQSPINYPTGKTPISITINDFNEDHILDLAVLNYDSQTITLLNGKNNGLFEYFKNYDLPGKSSTLVSKDVNNDSHQDFIVTNTTNDSILLLYGKGDSTFENYVSFNAGKTPFGLVLTDVNADSMIDLGVTNIGNSNISVLLSRVDPSLNNGTNISSQITPASIISKDFNNDKISDFAVSNFSSNNISIFINETCLRQDNTTSSSSGSTGSPNSTSTGGQPSPSSSNSSSSSTGGFSSPKPITITTLGETPTPTPTPTLTPNPDSKGESKVNNSCNLGFPICNQGFSYFCKEGGYSDCINGNPICFNKKIEYTGTCTESQAFCNSNIPDCRYGQIFLCEEGEASCKSNKPICKKGTKITEGKCVDKAEIINSNNFANIISSPKLPADITAMISNQDNILGVIYTGGCNPSFEIQLPDGLSGSEIKTIDLKDSVDNIFLDIKYKILSYDEVKNKIIISSDIPENISEGNLQFIINFTNGKKVNGFLKVINYTEVQNSINLEQVDIGKPLVNRLKISKIDNSITLTLRGNNFIGSKTYLKESGELITNRKDLHTAVTLFPSDLGFEMKRKTVRRRGKKLRLKIELPEDITSNTSTTLVITTPRGIISVPFELNPGEYIIQSYDFVDKL